MSSIAKKIAAMKAAKAAPPQAERGLNAPITQTVDSTATAVNSSTVDSTTAVQQTEAKPAKKSAAQLIAEMKAARSAQAAQTPVASVQTTSSVQTTTAKPLSEYANPVGTPEFEAEHEDLCNATRKLAQELEEEQDGIRYWLDRVHEQLRMQPELVHLLTDSQASALYRGIIARSNMGIVPAKAGKAKSSKATKVVHSAEDM